jgi:hypothetical protein
MPPKIDLQQHRNYRFQWRFLLRIGFYALILAGILYFLNALGSNRDAKDQDTNGIEVEVFEVEP